MNRTALALVPFLALVACGADTDNDGLSDSREAELGTNPESADTDGDGLIDPDELEAQTDPVLSDTDGDGYSDFQEIDFGSDPLDVESGIYTGGWPYNPHKDDLEDPGLTGNPSTGDRLGRFVAVDQYGQEVDIYDYAGQGKLVMIDVSALWCPPCRQLSGWLGGGSMAGMSGFDDVRTAVENGDMYWVTILTEDNNGTPYPDAEEVAWWEERYGAEKVALLADHSDARVGNYFDPGFYPALYLYDGNLEFVRGPGGDWSPPLTVAGNLLEEAAEQEDEAAE